jgi:Tol biopolymer transport system component
MRRSYVSAVAGAVSLALVSGLAAGAATSSHRSTAQIVFAANRSPTVNGEVYRIDATGKRVDLSESPALDADPAVSPDGKQVAFLSTRGGHVAVYLVGIDGRGRRRVSPSLWTPTSNDALAASFSWAADSRRLAVAANGSNPGEGGLYAWSAGRWRTLVSHLTNILGAPSWAPDGSMLAYTTSDDTIHVVSPDGKHLWRADAEGPPGWGAADRLAVVDAGAVGVYDRSGNRLAAPEGQAFAWSPSGAVLLVVNGKRLQLRRGGIGRPFLDVRLAHLATATVSFNHGIAWVGDSRMLLFGDNGWIGYDVTHRRLWRLPTAVANYNGIFLSDGSIAHWQQLQPGSPVTQLILQTPGTTSAHRLATAPICGDEYPAWTQAVPHARAVVYQSACSNPSADLYRIAPDGSGLRRLTDTTTDERQPGISPDGSSVVYVQQQIAEKCDGCPTTLWRIPSAGGTSVQLTHHTYQEETPFDANPSWSPDGQQIAFLRIGTNTPPTVFTMPASGGAARSLHVVGWNPAWGPTEIAYVTNTATPTVNTLDPATGAVQTVAKAAPEGLAWSRDGRLAYLQGDRRGRSSIVIVGSGSRPIALAPLLTPGAAVQGLAWSPDGTRFAVSATDANGIGEIYTIGIHGSGLKQLTHNLGAVGGLSWR